MEKITAVLQNIPRVLPKLIFLILGAVVVFELITSVRTLMAPLPVSKAVKVNPIQDGTLLLLSAQPEYKVDDTIPVLVRVDSGGHSLDGVDAVIHYDTTHLSATTSAVVRGTIFSEYPVLTVDQQNGVIRISGITGVGATSFSGIGELATVNFKALTAGKAVASLEYVKGSTTDSNMIDAGTPQDILGKVVNWEVNIK